MFDQEILTLPNQTIVLEMNRKTTPWLLGLTIFCFHPWDIIISFFLRISKGAFDYFVLEDRLQNNIGLHNTASILKKEVSYKSFTNGI